MPVSDYVIDFYKTFSSPNGLPANVVVHNPFSDPQRRAAIETFYSTFYSDNKPRIHVLGINPSKFHATSTGIHYTDGFALENYCGIKNDFSKSRELTSEFIYRVIEELGGAKDAFSNVFLWAMMPVSVTEDGKYVNYYESSSVDLLSSVVRSNVEWLSKVPSTGRVVILGIGENAKFFDHLEGKPLVYDTVRYLPHPRWIMQYNRKKIEYYIEQYIDAMS